MSIYNIVECTSGKYIIETKSTFDDVFNEKEKKPVFFYKKKRGEKVYSSVVGKYK